MLSRLNAACGDWAALEPVWPTLRAASPLPRDPSTRATKLRIQALATLGACHKAPELGGCRLL